MTWRERGVGFGGVGGLLFLRKHIKDEIIVSVTFFQRGIH